MKRLGLCLVLLALAPAAADEEWVRPYLPFLPGSAPAETVAFLVLAEAPGGPVPVAGARVAGYAEDVRPASLRAPLLAEAVTDEFGIANLPAPPEGVSHWLFSADGYAARHEALEDPGGADAVLLRPGRDYSFRLAGPDGVPLAGAEVEYVVGCGHGPAAASATTDAAGRAVFRGLADPEQGEIWARAPGIDPGPYRLAPPLAETGGERLVRASPGRTAAGLVLDAAGRPAAGVVVRGLDLSRGPVTETDPQGRFVLHGVQSGERIGLFCPGSALGDRGDALVDDFEPDVPLRIVLGDGLPAAPGAGEPRFLVDVRTDGLRGIPVRLVRLSDGLTVSGTTGEGLLGVPDQAGLLPVLLPPGRYRVTAGGGASGYERVEAETKVPAGAPVRMKVEESPTLDVRVDGEVAPGPADLLLPDRTLALPFQRTFEGWALNGTVHVPAAGPLSVWYGGATHDVGPAADGVRAVVLDAVPPTAIRFRLPEEAAGEGTPWVEIEPDMPLDPEGWDASPDDGGAYALRTTGAGPAVLLVRVDGFAPLRVPLSLPAEPGSVVDLGMLEPVPEEEVAFRVLDAAGRSFREVTAFDVDESEDLWFDPEEGLHVVFGAEPARVRIEADGWMPLTVGLRRDSPREIRFPGGMLRIRAVGEDGEALSFAGWVDGHRIESTGSELILTGVAAGPHTLIVGAFGRVGEVRRIVLGEGETRAVTARLPLR